MKKLLIILVIALMPMTIFADTKEDISSLSNRMYVLQKELLNPSYDNAKAVKDVKYIRSIAEGLTKRLSEEYKQATNLSNKTVIGNSIIASILYQFSLDNAEQYIQTGDLDQLSNMISKISLADLIVKSL